jgi:hypothetical protein
MHASGSRYNRNDGRLSSQCYPWHSPRRHTFQPNIQPSHSTSQMQKSPPFVCGRFYIDSPCFDQELNHFQAATANCQMQSCGTVVVDCFNVGSSSPDQETSHLPVLIFNGIQWIRSLLRHRHWTLWFQLGTGPHPVGHFGWQYAMPCILPCRRLLYQLHILVPIAAPSRGY